MHVVGFIIEIFTMHDHLNVKTVTLFEQSTRWAYLNKCQ